MDVKILVDKTEQILDHSKDDFNRLYNLCGKLLRSTDKSNENAIINQITKMIVCSHNDDNVIRICNHIITTDKLLKINAKEFDDVMIDQLNEIMEKLKKMDVVKIKKIYEKYLRNSCNDVDQIITELKNIVDKYESDDILYKLVFQFKYYQNRPNIEIGKLFNYIEEHMNHDIIIKYIVNNVSKILENYDCCDKMFIKKLRYRSPKNALTILKKYFCGYQQSDHSLFLYESIELAKKYYHCK